MTVEKKKAFLIEAAFYGVLLIVAGLFMKYLLGLMGAGDVPLAFEAENMAAYEQRKKDFAEKVH